MKVAEICGPSISDGDLMHMQSAIFRVEDSAEFIVSVRRSPNLVLSIVPAGPQARCHAQ